MFERYTEKARRVIFFARYEASQFGSPYIETEHLLLGLLREDKALTNRFLRSHASVESIRKQIEAHTTIREKVSTSVDLPLSNECKRVLAYAAEEAERLGHKHIGTEHLLLGLLREDKELWRLLAGPDFDSTLAIELRSAVPVKDAPEIPTSVDMPLSEGAKNTLRCAEAEAKKSIDAGHILLGLLKTGGDHPLFEILKQRGITYETVRARLPDETAGSAGA